MSVHLHLKEFPQPLRRRIHQELILNNGKEYMKFYSINGDIISLPYFYAKCLTYNWEMSFKDAFDTYKEDEDIEINKRTCHLPCTYKTTYSLREKQKPVLEDAISYLTKNGTVFLNVATGFGKSIALIHLINHTNYLSLVLVTRQTFLSQIETAFKTYTDAVVWIPSAKKKTPPPGVQVIICMPLRFKYISAEVRDQIATLAIDEAPLVCTAQCIPVLLSLRVRYIITCSATINRKDGMHIMLDMITGPSKVIKNLDVPVKYIKWLTSITVPYYPGHKGPDWGQHCQYICSHEQRNNMIVAFTKQIIEAPKGGIGPICDLMRKISQRKLHKIIMITNRVEEHVKVLQPMLIAAGLSCDYLDAKKKQYKECDVLVGTSNKLGIGFDSALSAIDYDGEPIDVVFQLVSSASEPLIIQQLGRACRVADHPAIFITMIDMNKISSNHSKAADRALSTLSDVEKHIYKGPVIPTADTEKPDKEKKDKEYEEK